MVKLKHYCTHRYSHLLQTSYGNQQYLLMCWKTQSKLLNSHWKLSLKKKDTMKLKLRIRQYLQKFSPSLSRSKPDPHLVKQLNENHANRYSFVCNALLNIGNCQSIERLNEVGFFHYHISWLLK